MKKLWIGLLGLFMIFTVVGCGGTTDEVKTYTVTYEINGHGTQPENLTEVTTLPASLPVLSEEGWTFDGWFEDNTTFQTPATPNQTLSSDLTLYAKWTEDGQVVAPDELDPYDEEVVVSGLDIDTKGNDIVYFGDTLKDHPFDVSIVLTKAAPSEDQDALFLSVKVENYSLDDTKVDYYHEGVYYVKIKARYLRYVSEKEVRVTVKADRYESLGVKHLMGIKCAESVTVSIGSAAENIKPSDVYLIYTENKYENGELVYIEERKRTGYELVGLNDIDTSKAGSYVAYVTYSETYDGNVTIQVKTFFTVIVGQEEKKMKKKIIAGLTLLSLGFVATSATLIPVHAAETEAPGNIYVSPTGKDTNAGTKESPLDFFTAQLRAVPGQTILMAEGSYKSTTRYMINNSGSNGKMITVKPEVEGSKVVFDFTGMKVLGTNRGIQLNGDYWHFYGVEVTGAGDNGMYIGGSNNIIENCQFYKNADTGLQLGRGSGSYKDISLWPSNNLIKNCTSFYNYDVETLGENADGFGAKLTIGYGNVFDGCIAYRNSDDGWDLYAKEDSGNIGTVVLYNCVSFENGFIAEGRELTDGGISFDTVNGDGIGFKLGGGVMEGDVIVENCYAFNNKLHGFSDNSNPGFIQMKNCTAFNNCIGVNADGTVAERGVPGTENKSNNFDMARDTKSYNSYYGLLSYVNNQANFKDEGNNSYNQDKFRGSTAYSIFQTSYDKDAKKENYLSVSEFQEASAYSGDVLPMLETPYTELTDASFASIASINAIGDKLYNIHTLLRNKDMSINMGDTLRVVDEKLLTFADGNPIGANLSKSSYAEYKHFDYSDLSGLDTDKLLVRGACDVLDVATNMEAVYQNFEVAARLNKCEVAWESSNEDIISFGVDEKISLSSSVFIPAYVSSPSEDTMVTIKATITRGEEKLEKSFELNVKARSAKLGALISSDTTSSYIVSRYQAFKEPTITVTDATSVDQAPLNPSLYTLTTTYEWSESKNGTYIKVDGIYTSVPGVFRVTHTAILKNDATQKASYSYFIFIGKDECEVDFAGGINSFRLNSVGFNISGNLSNITGKIYAVVVDKDVNLFSPEEIVALPNVQIFNFNAEKISFNFEADNSLDNGYKVYYMISDRVGKHFSNLYTKTINSEKISTHQEFYDLAQGVTVSDSSTVYNLQNDLDFKDFTWTDTAKPAAFRGTFNGNGHTISNLTVVTEVQKNGNVFYKLEDGTIMNVAFRNVSITNNNASAKLVGIIGAMEGGFVSSVDMENITSVGTSGSSTAVGALIGQIIGGVNHIDHITLINDDKQLIKAGNKYVGGVVGNIQMDTGRTVAEAYISYVVVKADFGDGLDSGGCIGGVVGRIKNDKKEYILQVNNCYYLGTITTGGNYNAGIVGSIESGAGSYDISNNFADVKFIYCKGDRLELDATKVDLETEYQPYAHKNCNPICGRATTLSTDILGTNNAGSWEEYYSSTISSFSFYFLYGPDYVPTAGFYKSFCDWDVENDWLIAEDGTVSLR